jgi:peptidoglycan hydrolase CwlO-like protein
MFGRGGRDRQQSDSNQPQSDVQKAAQDLRETLDKKDASVEDINTKLSALRQARDKARSDLKSAQKDLADVLTARQVATLVMMGMLE